MSDSWRPSASIAILRQRARYIQQIRRFFHSRDYLEVETPLLSRFANPDPHIESFSVSTGGQNYYLHTSPEFPMKRLVAAGSGSIYQICKVFRQGELGRLHNPEFTMVEWYRVGASYHDLMTEIDELLTKEFGLISSKKLTYSQIFNEFTGIDVHSATVADLRQFVQNSDINLSSELGDDLDAWRQLIMTHCIEPLLGFDYPVFVTDYPSSQAALAVIDPENPKVACRFELYFKGIELANGYQELINADEQRQRFEAQLATRQTHGQHDYPMDTSLIDALRSGLPFMSGVAMGLDRLIMLLLDKPAIDEVMSFDFNRA